MKTRFRHRITNRRFRTTFTRTMKNGIKRKRNFISKTSISSFTQSFNNRPIFCHHLNNGRNSLRISDRRLIMNNFNSLPGKNITLRPNVISRGIRLTGVISTNLRRIARLNRVTSVNPGSRTLYTKLLTSPICLYRNLVNVFKIKTVIGSSINSVNN